MRHAHDSYAGGSQVPEAVACLHRSEVEAEPPWLTRSSLLPSCVRVCAGRLWGQDSIWLHVSMMNAPAQALYQRAGFTVVDEGLSFTGPLRQILMKKELVPLAPRRSLAEAAEGGGGGLPEGVQGKVRDGVFVWEEDPAGTAKR
jgi:hypothetical protein